MDNSSEKKSGSLSETPDRASAALSTDRGDVEACEQAQRCMCLEYIISTYAADKTHSVILEKVVVKTLLVVSEFRTGS